MTFLMFKVKDGEKQKDYERLLEMHASGVKKSVELLLYTLNLVQPDGGKYSHGVVFMLARHVAEEIDATAILVENGSIDPCMTHLRSAFEATLSLRFILEDDCERRALSYHVKDIRDRLKRNELYDERTEAGKNLREKSSSEDIGLDVLDSIQTYDFDSENENLLSVLSEPPYHEIQSEWESRSGSNQRSWFSLFGGPNNIRDLAEHLGLGLQYVLLYKQWSDRIHAGRVMSHVGADKSDPSGETKAIMPLRHPEQISVAYNFGTAMCIQLVLILSEKFLETTSCEFIKQTYREEIVPINQKVRSLKIEAAWR